MNELVRDLVPRYVPNKYDRNRRRIAPGRALTGLAMSPMNELVWDLSPGTPQLSLTTIRAELHPWEC